MDHHSLNFWLWACLHDAETYLESSRQFFSIISDPKDWTTFHDKRLSAQRQLDLDKYHFTMTMGSLVKRLTRLAPLFPSIQPAFNAAEHLREEGLYLRNMIEHEEANLEAAKKGTPRGGFVRKSNLLSNLPGNRQGEADATSTIVNGGVKTGQRGGEKPGQFAAWASSTTRHDRPGGDGRGFVAGAAVAFRRRG